uniref:Choline transporter-like protein n=1 Tax=Sphaeramia orbicularis TaxID=375764 RepID=A0A673CY49_9TELE
MPEEGEYFGKHGEPRKYDPSFKGPIQNRGCTDIACCILFIVAILGYFAVGILAWSQGDPRKVIYPTDSRGQFCGQAGTPLENKPYLFYFNIMKCATYSKIVISWHSFCFPHYIVLLYLYMLQSDDKCFLIFRCVWRTCHGFDQYYLNQNFHCVNKRESFHRNATVVIEARQVVMKIFEDYTQSWYWILIGLVIAMLTSLLFIVLLRFLAGIMVWIMIALVILVIGYGIFHCYMEYAALKGEPGANVTLQELGFQTDFTVYLQIRQTWLAFSQLIILAIVEVIIILLLIFLRKRILIAIALIKEASRAIGHVMCSLVYPLFTFFLLVIVIAYWAVTAVYPFNSQRPLLRCVPCINWISLVLIQNYSISPMKAQCPDSECLFAFYGGETVYHKYLIGLQFYNVFLFFWCANFVTALGQMTLAGAFASYYWAFVKPDDMPAFPVFSALGRSLRYHTGTLAFGSLILSIIQIIRVLLEYLDHKLKGAQNKFAKFLLCCLKCCFWCLEKFIKFLNRNAYIMVAIYGKNFCTSARDAFFLLLRNMIRVAVLDKVTDFLLFLGKLLIVGLVGVFAFFFFSGRVRAFENTAPSLHYYWVPILTVVIGSYLIAHGFFSVYAMCVDTLFLCFLEDLERNDGSAERPYLMPESLRKILNKKNKNQPAE